MQKPTITPEEVYQFIQDANEQRQREIRMEDLIEHISRSTTLNWN